MFKQRLVMAQTLCIH